MHSDAFSLVFEQSAYSLGLQSGLLRIMTDVEKFALLLAALCHDLEHPVCPRSDAAHSRRS